MQAVEHHRFELTSDEYDRLNSLYPQSKGSSLIGKRAEEIVRIHFRRNDPRCQFEAVPKGADLHVVSSDRSRSAVIEVKGTASPGVAWQQLKVSSQHSWRLLAEERVPVYRVSRVFERVPSIYVLLHGQDFILEQEPRWTLKRIQAGGENPSPSAGSKDDLAAPTIPERTRSSKYDALRKYLEGKATRSVTLQFKDAAAVLGFPLPSSAHQYQAFWANQSNTTNRPWARAWQEAGYDVDSYRLSEMDGWVRFKRRDAEP